MVSLRPSGKGGYLSLPLERGSVMDPRPIVGSTVMHVALGICLVLGWQGKGLLLRRCFDGAVWLVDRRDVL